MRYISDNLGFYIDYKATCMPAHETGSKPNKEVIFCRYPSNGDF